MPEGVLTLREMVEGAQEVTHLGEAEILDIVLSNWPRTSEVRPTQYRLLVWLIEKKVGELVKGGAAAAL